MMWNQAFYRMPSRIRDSDRMPDKNLAIQLGLAVECLKRLDVTLTAGDYR